MRKVSWALALVAASVGGARPLRAAAPAGPNTVERAVEVDPGQTCLDEERLERHVRAWLGNSRVDPGVHVTVEGDRSRADVAEFKVVHDGKARVRRFDRMPAGCEETHAAVALAIALAIDGGLLRRITALGPPSPTTLLTVQAGFGYEVLPNSSFGGRAGVEHELVDWLGVVAELGGQYSPGNAISGTSGHFDAMLFSLNVRACAGRPLADAFRVALCTGGSAGVVHASGAEYTVSQSSTGFWGGVIAGVRVDLRVGWRWVLDVDLAVPLWSPSFRVERSGGGDAVRQAKVAGLLVNLGPAVEF